MAVSNAVLSAADTATAVDNDVLNPTVTNTGRCVVHVTLIFDGVDFVPNDLQDALDAQYATVDTLRGQLSHGIYEFRISA